MSKPKHIKISMPTIAEIVKDHYASWNIQLDTKNYVWNGETLKMKVKDEKD
jgi:hypothetical protein